MSSINFKRLATLLPQTLNLGGFSEIIVTLYKVDSIEALPTSLTHASSDFNANTVLATKPPKPSKFPKQLPDESEQSNDELSQVSPDLLPEILLEDDDLIDYLCKRQLLNVNNIYGSNANDTGAYNIININFPEEYAYLLTLPKLDEATLRSDEKIWPVITAKAETIEEMIKKETVLTCLDWAQLRLNVKIPVIEVALLSFEAQKNQKDRHGLSGTAFFFKIKLTDFADTFIGSSIRRYSVVELRSLDNAPHLSDLEVVVVAIKDKTISLRTRNLYNVANHHSNDLYEAFKSYKNERVSIHETPLDFSLRCMFKSIERISNGGLKNIISPKVDTNITIGEFKSSLKKILPSLKRYSELNDAQAQALYSICTSSHGNAPYILYGPPGTGKTRTIGATIRCLLKMDKTNRILVTAPSNMAADTLARELMNLFEKYSISKKELLRLRSFSSEYTKRDKTLDQISCFTRNEKGFEIPKIEKFKNYRVIVSTIGCSPHIAKTQVSRGFFSHIFIDEAGQASHGDMWLPLGSLATSQTKIILCGDQNQLGPVLNLDFSSVVSRSIESALERYSIMDMYNEDDRLYCQLRRSYRCHPYILNIASALFYDRRILSGLVDREEPFEEWRALPNPGFPLLFVNVDGSEFARKETKSCANLEEVRAVLEYIRVLLNDFDVDPRDIGVISPYKHQTDWLINELQYDKNGRNIHVDSVERFQGSERKIILMTATRTEMLGFLACNKRLCTSITRALHLLIVVGNKSLLAKHSTWERFMGYCMMNGSMIDWSGRVETFR